MKFDLRKNNITNEDDAIEFLDFIVERAPQLKEVFKKQKFQVAALRNRIAFKDKQLENSKPSFTPVENTAEAVSGDAPKEVQDDAAKRLAQIKEAVKPGDIGHLEVKREATKVEVEQVEGEETIPEVRAEDVTPAAAKVAKAQSGKGDQTKRSGQKKSK